MSFQINFIFFCIIWCFHDKHTYIQKNKIIKSFQRLKATLQLFTAQTFLYYSGAACNFPQFWQIRDWKVHCIKNNWGLLVNHFRRWSTNHCQRGCVKSWSLKAYLFLSNSHNPLNPILSGKIQICILIVFKSLTLLTNTCNSPF